MEKSITVSRTIERSLTSVVEELADKPGDVLAAATKAAVTKANEVIVHLEGRWAWFDLDESVEAVVGALEQDRSMARVPLSWKADKHKRLLPSLRGHLGLYSLSAKHTEISYTATYAPPLGLFGGIEDFLMGRRILDAVLGRFLEEIVTHLEDRIPAG
ncbi:MAG: hypothetical protein OES13_08405 [Acidimicrobiia bacterium]|nr:hypothetical protein [Acidimicrobiia bacterium]